VLYAPWPTPVAGLVTDAGGTVVGGLEVLFWQATVQVELMTGRPAPIAAMRAALDAY
jgi:shikimate dehydrogenase